MTIWLLNPYGPIPGEGWREYRYTMIGEALAANGHTVVWWTANFSHHFKRFRSPSWQDRQVSPGFTIRLVPTRSYVKNIGLGRIAFEMLYLWRLWRATRNGPRPDLIVTVNPPQTTSFLAVHLARLMKARVVVDVFDLWPELFLLAIPRPLRFMGKLLFTPWYLLRWYSIRHADGVVAVCEDYMNVAKKALGGLQTPVSVVYIGVDVGAIHDARLPDAAAEAFRRSAGKQPGRLWAIYPGTLGNNYDIPTLLATALLLQKRDIPVTIVIAGDGPLRGLVEEFIQTKCPTHLHYAGKLEPETLTRYYQASDIGLSPYVGESTVAMPTKIYDFLAAGLPIINSLRSEVAGLLRRDGSGLAYAPGDPESLFQALRDLADDPAVLRRMAGKAALAAQRFDKKVQYDTLVAFIEKLPPVRDLT